MFNLSNDEYYNPRQIASSSLLGFESTIVQHSIPTLDLHLPWFPPHLSSSTLRHFHRPQLRIRCPSHETTTGFYTISDLHKHMAKKTKVCIFSYGVYICSNLTHTTFKHGLYKTAAVSHCQYACSITNALLVSKLFGV